MQEVHSVMITHAGVIDSVLVVVFGKVSGREVARRDLGGLVAVGLLGLDAAQRYRFHFDLNDGRASVFE